MNNIVLVCGSEGSLMQAVIPKLIANGYGVVGVDNLMRHGTKKGSGYTFHRVDLTDQKKVDKIFKEYAPTYVIQAAAQIYGIAGFNYHADRILSNDVILQSNVLNAAIFNDCNRFVYISSSMVYETFQEDRSVKETDIENIITPKTEYGLSKLVGERLTKAFTKQNFDFSGSMEYTIWRPFNIITPHEKVVDTNNIGMSHVFADYLSNILIKQKNPLPIIGDGHQIRCFTNIEDVASVIADHSFSEKTKNQEFNIGNPEPVTMRELAYIIYQYSPNTKKLRFQTVEKYPNDVKVRIPDVSKLKRVLGKKDYIPLEQSIDLCVAHLKAEGLI